MYVFYGIQYETVDHLSYQCNKTQWVWNIISTMTANPICFPNGFIYGDRLVRSHYYAKMESLTRVTARYLWKARCDAIF